MVYDEMYLLLHTILNDTFFIRSMSCVLFFSTTLLFIGIGGHALVNIIQTIRSRKDK